MDLKVKLVFKTPFTINSFTLNIYFVMSNPIQLNKIQLSLQINKINNKNN